MDTEKSKAYPFTAEMIWKKCGLVGLTSLEMEVKEVIRLIRFVFFRRTVRVSPFHIRLFVNEGTRFAKFGFADLYVVGRGLHLSVGLI